MDAKEIIQSLNTISEENDTMKKFLEDLYNSGDAYNSNINTISFIQNNWLRLRKIVNPDFDDSE